LDEKRLSRFAWKAAGGNTSGVQAGEWTSAEHVERYIEQADEYPRRREGETLGCWTLGQIGQNQCG
jgi:hypothetical protein